MNKENNQINNDNLAKITELLNEIPETVSIEVGKNENKKLKDLKEICIKYANFIIDSENTFITKSENEILNQIKTDFLRGLSPNKSIDVSKDRVVIELENKQKESNHCEANFKPIYDKFCNKTNQNEQDIFHMCIKILTYYETKFNQLASKNDDQSEFNELYGGMEDNDKSSYINKNKTYYTNLFKMIFQGAKLEHIDSDFFNNVVAPNNDGINRITEDLFKHNSGSIIEYLYESLRTKLYSQLLELANNHKENDKSMNVYNEFGVITDKEDKRITFLLTSVKNEIKEILEKVKNNKELIRNFFIDFRKENNISPPEVALLLKAFEVYNYDTENHILSIVHKLERMLKIQTFLNDLKSKFSSNPKLKKFTEDMNKNIEAEYNLYYKTYDNNEIDVSKFRHYLQRLLLCNKNYLTTIDVFLNIEEALYKDSNNSFKNIAYKIKYMNLSDNEIKNMFIDVADKILKICVENKNLISKINKKGSSGTNILHEGHNDLMKIINKYLDKYLDNINVNNFFELEKIITEEQNLKNIKEQEERDKKIIDEVSVLNPLPYDQKSSTKIQPKKENDTVNTKTSDDCEDSENVKKIKNMVISEEPRFFDNQSAQNIANTLLPYIKTNNNAESKANKIYNILQTVSTNPDAKILEPNQEGIDGIKRLIKSDYLRIKMTTKTRDNTNKPNESLSVMILPIKYELNGEKQENILFVELDGNKMHNNKGSQGFIQENKKHINECVNKAKQRFRLSLIEKETGFKTVNSDNDKLSKLKIESNFNNNHWYPTANRPGTSNSL